MIPCSLTWEFRVSSFLLCKGKGEVRKYISPSKAENVSFEDIYKYVVVCKGILMKIPVNLLSNVP